MESYNHDFDSVRKQLDDAEQKGYIDGQNDAHRQYPISIGLAVIFGFIVGLILQGLLV